MKPFVVLVFLAFVQTAISQSYINPLRKNLNKNSAEPNPAVKVQLTTKGLNYAASIAADLIDSEVRKTKIPNISGKKFVRYEVKDIRINHFRKPVPDISMIPANGIKLNFRNAALEANGRWKYRKGFVKDSGSVKVSTSSFSIGLSINIRVNSAGRPSLNAHSCNVNVGGFSVKLRGGASFLYNLIFKAFKGKAKSAIEKSICKASLDAINKNGNKKLATLNLEAKIGDDLVLDYFLTGPPTFAGTYFETGHRGVFVGDKEKSKVPLIATPPTGMIGFSIAAEAFNSAGRVIFTKNLLHKEFDIPAIKNLLVMLDSSFSKARVFALVKPLEPPKISITQGVLSISLEAEAELIGRLSDNKQLSAMTVEASIEASTSVVVRDEKVILQLSKLVPRTNVKISHIGSITPAFLNRFIEETIKLALPALNDKLLKGFPLPKVDGVKFLSSSIQLHQGYLSVTSDVVYKP